MMDEAEVRLARGEADSALALLTAATDLGLTEYGRSDTTVLVFYRKAGQVNYYYFRNDAEAETLYTRALSISARASGRRSIAYARWARDLARLYTQRRRPAESDSLFQEAMSIMEETLGPDSPELAGTMLDCCLLYWTQSRWEEAEALARQAVAILEALPDPAHPDMPHALRILAWQLANQGKYEEAEPLAMRGLRMWEETYGPDDQEIVSFLDCLGDLRKQWGKYAAAESVYVRAIELSGRERDQGFMQMVRYLQHLHMLGVIAYEMGRYAVAESRCLEGIALIEEELGPDHLLLEDRLYLLGITRGAMGLYEGAEKVLLRMLAMREKRLGPDHWLVARALGGLGSVYSAQGRYAELEIVYKRSLAIREKVMGPEHPALGYDLQSLGWLYTTMGRYADAEPMYRRALEVRLKSYGPENKYVAASMASLAGLYYTQRDYARAEHLFKEAISVREAAVGPDHPSLAADLSGLAGVYEVQERYDEAEPLRLRALSIREASLGPDHANVGMALVGLGDLYVVRGEYARAESLFERALAIWEVALGPDHPKVGSGLASLADLNYRRGRYGEAEEVYLRVLDIYEEAMGPDHNYVASTLEQICGLYRMQGRHEEAVHLATRAVGIRHRNFTYNAPVLSERDALAFSVYLRESVDNYLSCFLDSRTDGGDGGEVTGAADILVSTKGLVSDVVLERQRSVVDEADSTTQALARTLRYTKFQLSQVFVEGPGEDLEAYRSEVDSLSGLARDLEAELARASASFRLRQEAGKVDAAGVAARLPENAVLVEYVRYNHRELKPGRLIPRYVMLVLRPAGDAFITALGDASEIDGLVQDWHGHMMRVAESGSEPTIIDLTEHDELSRRLYDVVWRPAAELAGGAGAIIVAPDGALNTLAFGCLRDGGSEYLIEKHRFHYASAGRHVFRPEPAGGEAMGLFALGDPDFGAVASERVAAARASGDSVVQVAFATRNVRSACSELGDVEVTPLPGTRREVELIAGAWERATVEPVIACYGEEASEERFKAEAPGRRVIHLATHGYFLGGACRPEDVGADYVGENPLLLSGLFFAGANLHGAGADSAGADDGILTAYEVSGMNLDGAELVVLSACETGLGEVAEGEGVYGLRRAFQMAGAQTVVSALWPVSDKATADLMGRLYLEPEGGPAGTLREAQLESIRALREDGLPDHPFTWAAFIAVGGWE
jgi:CHAT domain-containing protein/tetratricopeptide (TPR) repeat protein